ncbi:hypothetical protein ABW19_dt0201238 [Dactylella cylindrospora]|nr:hypothetical protein ABW19_dt0201238 [Dactylella cylindrospora]
MLGEVFMTALKKVFTRRRGRIDVAGETERSICSRSSGQFRTLVAAELFEEWSSMTSTAFVRRSSFCRSRRSERTVQVGISAVGRSRDIYNSEQWCWTLLRPFRMLTTTVFKAFSNPMARLK